MEACAIFSFIHSYLHTFIRLKARFEAELGLINDLYICMCDLAVPNGRKLRLLLNCDCQFQLISILQPV